jgi:hypothetical protein
MISQEEAENIIPVSKRLVDCFSVHCDLSTVEYDSCSDSNN